MESHHTTFGLFPTQKKLVIYHQKRILNIQSMTDKVAPQL